MKSQSRISKSGSVDCAWGHLLHKLKSKPLSNNILKNIIVAKLYMVTNTEGMLEFSVE